MLKPLLAASRRALLLAALVSPFAASAQQQLTVSAAASLTDAFKALGPGFEAGKPGVTLRFNFAASGVLLQQMVQGAPVDVFASADQETMNRAVEQKLADPATRADFAANALVLIVPAEGAPAVSKMADLQGASVKRIAIGKTATVPVGRYTQQSLEAAGLWAALEPKFVQGESVRQVLDYVARGEVDAGFVYRTDAAIMADKVKVAETVPTRTPVRYPVAVVSESRNKALARDFTTYLAGPEAQAILAKYGFTKP